MSGPEKNSLDPMDQTPLTRFIKVFDLKDEAIVFQNTVNGVLDTVNGFLGDDNRDLFLHDVGSVCREYLKSRR